MIDIVLVNSDGDLDRAIDFFCKDRNLPWRVTVVSSLSAAITHSADFIIIDVTAYYGGRNVFEGEGWDILEKIIGK